MNDDDQVAMSDLSFAREFPMHCVVDVIRHGEFCPCEKPAVAVKRDTVFGSFPYPVCAFHARGDMVPLVELLFGEASR